MRARVWVGFGVYCAAEGSRWLLDAALPSSLPSLLHSAVHQGLVFVVLGLAASLGRKWRVAGWLRIGVLFGAVFALPNLLVTGAAGHVSGLTETLAFTLVPVVVVSVVAQQSLGFGMQADASRLLGPALAGVFGAALLIPFTMPESVTGKLWLCALALNVALAGWALVWLHARLAGVPVVVAAALASGVNAVACAAFSRSDWAALRGLDHRSLAIEVVLALGFDGPLVALGVWLLREMAPIRLVTRYPLAILVPILESYVLLRPSASWITAAGALLMVGSCVWLLRAGAEGQDESGRDDVRRDDFGSTLGL